MKKFELRNKYKSWLIYVEIRKAIYDLPEASALDNKLLK